MGGGLVALWSPLGLAVIVVAALVGFVILKAKASTVDMNQAQVGLTRMRDDLLRLRDSVEHPDSPSARLQALEVLRRFGQITPAEYEARRQAIADEPAE
jgi:hypothetical protein